MIREPKLLVRVPSLASSSSPPSSSISSKKGKGASAAVNSPKVSSSYPSVPHTASTSGSTEKKKAGSLTQMTLNSNIVQLSGALRAHALGRLNSPAKGDASHSGSAVGSYRL